MSVVKALRKFISSYYRYGINYSITIVVCHIFDYRKSNTRLSKLFLEKKHKIILSYLDNKYKKYLYLSTANEVIDNRYKKCIWTAWLQGEENAPEIIKMNLESMRYYSNNHPVIVLTNNNINKYIAIPVEIQEKHEKGIISNAHFADIIRMMVLSSYGGLWLDATTYVSSPIKETIFDKSFYSINRGDNNNQYISRGKWIVAIIGGCDNNYYFKIISKILNQYWIDHDSCIDYFVFDYVIALLYYNNESFKYLVDNIEISNKDIYTLGKIINEEYDKYFLNRIFSKSCFFILTYKKQYMMNDRYGRKTYYAILKENVFRNRDEL